jgi:O-antigen/teichoic acid export membrane protein
MDTSTEATPVLEDKSTANRQDRFFQTDHLKKDLQGRSLRGGVVTLGAQSIKFLLGLLSTATLARLLRPQDFGLVAMVTSITSFVALFRDLGLSNATVQRLQVTHEQISFLFWINVALSLGATLVVLALAPAIAWFYHEPRLVWVTFAVSLSFVAGGLAVQHQALLRRQMQFKSLALRDLVAMICGIVLSIILAWFGFGYWALVAGPVTTNVMGCILLWTICDWRPGAFRRGVGARGMLVFGGNLTMFNLVNYFTRNFDNILIGRVLGAGPLGIYSKAYGLLMLPIAQVNFPMAAVLLPGLSRLQNEAVEYAKLFINAVRSIALLTIPIVIFSFFFAHDVVLVLLGKRWLSVAPVFQWLAPAALFGAISFVPGWLCQSLGRSRRQLNYALISAPICVAGFLIGIHWGIAGVAASYSLTFSCLFCWYVWYASKDSPVRFSEIVLVFLWVLFPALLAGVTTWVANRLLISDMRPLFSLILDGLIFLVIYLGIAFLIPKERALILSAVKSARKFIHR